METVPADIGSKKISAGTCPPHEANPAKQTCATRTEPSRLKRREEELPGLFF